MRVGTFLAIPVFLGLLFFSGCDPEPYPDDLTYPLRTDLLVVESQFPDRNFPEPLGAMEQSIAVLQELAPENVLDPAKLPDKWREPLAEALEKVFGRPAAPRVALDNKEALKELRLDSKTLAKGSVLYRRHCLHCHGVSGDGRGPTAPWVNPHPRDYRRGKFKFTSVDRLSGDGGGSEAKPTRGDLLRTLREGIEGTSMPSFKHLSEEERNQLVSYVIHLSLRGSTEFDAMSALLDENRAAALGVTRQTAVAGVKDFADYHLKRWYNSKPIDVLPYPKEYEYDSDGKPLKEDIRDKRLRESIQRGYELFIEKGACLACHTDFGRQAPYKVDAWGTLVRPMDLTAGVYRGGRRPVDIYYRIHSGIEPSAMSGAKAIVKQTPFESWLEASVPFSRETKTEIKMFDAQAVARQTDQILAPIIAAEDMWDLVNFVKALPYPAMLPEDIRKKVYSDRWQASAK